MPPDERAVLLLANLPGLTFELEQGAVIVVGRDRLRVRSLPLLSPSPRQRDG
jgi:hypothetical protein